MGRAGGLNRRPSTSTTSSGRVPTRADFTLLHAFTDIPDGSRQPGAGTNARVTLAEPARPGGHVVQLFATNAWSVPSRSEPESNSYVAMITAYIGTLGASAPLEVVIGD